MPFCSVAYKVLHCVAIGMIVLLTVPLTRVYICHCWNIVLDLAMKLFLDTLKNGVKNLFNAYTYYLRLLWMRVIKQLNNV